MLGDLPNVLFPLCWYSKRVLWKSGVTRRCKTANIWFPCKTHNQIKLTFRAWFVLHVSEPCRRPVCHPTSCLHGKLTAAKNERERGVERAWGCAWGWVCMCVCECSYVHACLHQEDCDSFTALSSIYNLQPFQSPWAQEQSCLPFSLSLSVWGPHLSGAPRLYPNSAATPQTL